MWNNLFMPRPPNTSGSGGPHKNRAPPSVQRITVAINASGINRSHNGPRTRCPPQEKPLFASFLLADKKEGGARGRNPAVLTPKAGEKFFAPTRSTKSDQRRAGTRPAPTRPSPSPRQTPPRPPDNPAPPAPAMSAPATNSAAHHRHQAAS